MKHKLLNKLLTFTLLIMGGAIFNPAWADDVTVTFTSSSDVGTGTSASGNNSVSKGGITISCTAGGFAISGGAHYRWASGSTTTISSSVGNIKSIIINGPSGTGSNSISKFGTNSGWTLDSSKGTYTWTGDAASVSVKANNGQVRPTSIVVTYTPNVTTYAITKSATNGTISTKVSSVEVTEAEEDATVTIEATPNTGYSFTSWNVTKTSGGAAVSVANASANPTTFTMPAEAVTVAATFTINSHALDLTTTNGTCAVTVNGDDWNGSSAIAYGAAVVITATPSSGYLFDAWNHTLTSPTISSNVISFSMPDEDVIIEAQYIDASSVKSITISDAIEHGTVTASANTASAGDIIELTATPDDGYAFSAWMVTDDADNEVSVTNNKFTMPDADVTVSATFTPIAVTGVTLNKTSASISVGDTETLTATVAPADALNKAVTWTSSNTSVATVSGGVVTAVAAGSATITVTTTNGSFTATCIVTVFDLSVGGSYVAVTEDEDLVAGDKYIIVYNGNTAMSTTQNTNNRGRTTVKLTDGVITLSNTSTVAAVMLGGTSGAWTLQTLDGYLQSPSKSNYLTCSETVTDDNQKWTITTADAKTTIKNNGHTSYYLQYNTSSNIFSCYTNTQKDVQLYHKIVLEDAELSFASSTAIATYGSIFSGPVLTNENSAPLTWTSSNKTVATVNSSGEVTLLKAGETTITATATGRYTGEASYTLTVNRAATSLAFAASNPSIYVGDDTYTQTATITPVGADNTISYAFVGEHGAATINSSTGTVTFNSYEGELTIEASAAQTDRYAAPSTQSYILTVVGNKIASIALSSTSGSTTYGANVTIDATFADEDYLDVEGAGVTATGFNSSVATYSFNASTKKITITPIAVGTTTFTFQANEVTGYDEGSTVNFTITVNAPVGLTKSALDFDFTTNDWGLPTSYDNSDTEKSYTHSTNGYTIKLYGPKSNGFKFSSEYLIMGKSGAYLTLPTFDKAVSRIDVYGKSGASESVKQNIFVGETEVSTETIGATETHVYEIAAGYQAAGNIYTLKVTSSHNTQITKIVVHFAVPTITAKINASGYATFCSEYPLDFSDYATADYSAWEITNINESEDVYTITFNKLTGTIKGGQGILLKGTANATVTLTSSNSTNVLDNNLLVGTTAPTYVTAGEYYGLSGNNFVRVATSTVPAGKALLPADEVDGSSPVKAFTFIFEDDADGIRTIENVSIEEAAQIFDLSGRRLNKMQKGINIVNGRKVLK